MAADYVFGYVCVCLACSQFCKQDISKTNLWIFAKFIADTSYAETPEND